MIFVLAVIAKAILTCLNEPVNNLALQSSVRRVFVGRQTSEFNRNSSATGQRQFRTSKTIARSSLYFIGARSTRPKIGRTIGFPTANIALKRKVSPVRGVFAVKLHWHDSDVYEGVANVGFRPTVNGQTCQLEVHLFDFDGDLYGRTVEVELVAKIRDEQPFKSLDALKRQIKNDADRAKALLGFDAG